MIHGPADIKLQKAKNSISNPRSSQSTLDPIPVTTVAHQVDVGGLPIMSLGWNWFLSCGMRVLQRLAKVMGAYPDIYC